MNAQVALPATITFLSAQNNPRPPTPANQFSLICRRHREGDPLHLPFRPFLDIDSNAVP
jgi:hypothetical protein